jgi:quercetin dioxygenase-like cupin family protein
MAEVGRVIENRATGERIVVRASGAATGGRVFTFDLYLAPGGHVPARHVHPEQEERFRVLSGRLRVRVGRRTFVAAPGDTVVVPPGTAHWFANAGPGEFCARVEVRPALHLEDLFAEASQIQARRLGPVARLSDLAAMLLQFSREVSMPGVPRAVARVGLASFAALGGRRRGRGDGAS